MKSIYLIIFGALLFASCGEVQEEITIETNGSGTYEISSDMIPMMRGMMEGLIKMGMTEEEQADSAAIAAKIEEKIWEGFGDDVDSVIVFGDKIPEHIKNNQEKMALLEDAQMYMRGGKDKGYLKTGVTYQYKDINDFQKFIELGKESTNVDKKAFMLFGDSNTKMEITKNSFYRSTVKNESDDITPDTEELTKMFSGINLITVINTPKKIKSVKVKTYEVIKQSTKSVTLKYKLEDMVTNKPTEIMIKW